MNKLTLFGIAAGLMALVLFSGCLQPSGQATLSGAGENCRLVPYQDVVAQFSEGDASPEPYTVQECKTLPREVDGETVLVQECQEVTKYRAGSVAEEQVTYLEETRYKEVCD